MATAFPSSFCPRAQLALDTLQMRPTRGIATGLVHMMQVSEIEHFAEREPGAYARDPSGVYLAMVRNIGACFIDQFIPENPMTMGDAGYRAETAKGATTGAEGIILDGMEIDSPEAVVEHMERFVLPEMERAVGASPEGCDAAMARCVENEVAVQALFGSDLLKVPYAGFYSFPYFRYGQYGYEHYFLAYLMYPEVMERDFALQATLAETDNAAAAHAIREAGLPPVLRLDHDMADGRGTLVDIQSLDRIWFPHFARAIRPFLDAGIRLIWHCDGNLMQMVPRLIESGVGGFQGFQYECGMDYERICSMTDRDGGLLQIWAGVSVTTTLPFGTPDDVRRELRFLVEHGPDVGLCLACSSSIAPGVPRRNLEALVEGLRFYRQNGRR